MHIFHSLLVPKSVRQCFLSVLCPLSSTAAAASKLLQITLKRQDGLRDLELWPLRTPSSFGREVRPATDTVREEVADVGGVPLDFHFSIYGRLDNNHPGRPCTHPL